MNTSVARHFSRAAESYERGAGLHRHVAASLLELLPEPVEIGEGRILELGCGTGVLTTMVRQRYPEALICAVDIAEGMAGCLQESHAEDAKLACVVADARTFVSRVRFDLVVSSSSLHWATPLPGTMANVGSLLRPGGRFVVAMMVDDTLRELHALRRTIAPTKIPLGRLPTGEETVAAFKEAGFVLNGQTDETVRARYHSADDFLRTIHAQGLTGGAVSRGPLPLTRSELKNLVSAYDLAYRDLQGGVYASFKVLYLGATCAERPASAGRDGNAP